LSIKTLLSKKVLVSAGSKSIVTDITENTYFSLIDSETRGELGYKSESNIVPLALIIALISFCETHFTTHPAVRDQLEPECNFSILGRFQVEPS